MRSHINNVADIIDAWDSGKPIAGLCGVVRTISAKKHDKLRRKGKLTPCADCLRIAGAFVATGQADSIRLDSSSAQIRNAATVTRSWTYTLTTTKISDFPLGA